jgi:hypothetical protein
MLYDYLKKHKMKGYLITTILLFIVLTKANSTEILKAIKWEKLDIKFALPYQISNPFQLVLTCEFTSPGGTKMNVSGFYKGGNEWIIRFCPDKSGKWHAESHSSVNVFDGKGFEIVVDQNSSSNHGGVILNRINPQKLYFEDGSPYNMLAFEADWLFALDYGNAELPKTLQLIELIKANGFNQIVMNVYAYDVYWKKDKTLKPQHEYGGRIDIFPYLGSNKIPDYSALNTIFFQHLDKVIKL